ncbi:hypothetical protein MRX96_008251 [Rhipicephalus microplus]
MAAPSSVDDRGIELTKQLRDPYAVFYDEDVRAPVPDVQPLSSLEEFADKYMRDKKAMVEAETTPRVRREVQAPSGRPRARVRRPAEPREVAAGQRPPPQMHAAAVVSPRPVARCARSKRTSPNAASGVVRATVASVVERSAMGGMHAKGPLSILFRAVRDRMRVKVWTRSHTRVRSILTGFVHAYDRHINLALADVDEPVPQQQVDEKKEESGKEEITSRAVAREPLELRLPAWATTSGLTRRIPEEDEHASGCPTPSATPSRDSSEQRPKQRIPRRKALCIPLQRPDVQPEPARDSSETREMVESPLFTICGHKTDDVSNSRVSIPIAHSKAVRRNPSDPPSDPRPLPPEERTEVVAQTKRPARTGRVRRHAAAPTLAPRSRHVNQLFVRGENVVSVALMPV